LWRLHCRVRYASALSACHVPVATCQCSIRYAILILESRFTAFQTYHTCASPDPTPGASHSKHNLYSVQSFSCNTSSCYHQPFLCFVSVLFFSALPRQARLLPIASRTMLVHHRSPSLHISSREFVSCLEIFPLQNVVYE